MISARVRNSGSELAWYFSAIALIDSASILACAGSYTPQGKSQCARTTVRGVSRRGSRIEPSWVVCDDPLSRPYSGREARAQGRANAHTVVHGPGARAVHGPGVAP